MQKLLFLSKLLVRETWKLLILVIIVRPHVDLNLSESLFHETQGELKKYILKWMGNGSANLNNNKKAP